VTGLTNSDGKLIQSYTYDAFGNILQVDSYLKGKQTVTNPYRFSTKEYNSRSGLIYFGARYYDPKIGRFITPDPWPGFVQDPTTFANKYPYCANDPVNFIDPFGLCKEKKDFIPCWMLGIGVGSLATPWPGDEELAWLLIGVYVGTYAVYQGGKVVIDWMVNNPPFHWNLSKGKEADYPANPDEWVPPPGVRETDTGKRTGGKHRQWKDETGRTVRRWDRGEPGKPGWRGRDHWHDENGRHVLPK
jgi:RHS repeat-associated protein